MRCRAARPLDAILAHDMTPFTCGICAFIGGMVVAKWQPLGVSGRRPRRRCWQSQAQAPIRTWIYLVRLIGASSLDDSDDDTDAALSRHCCWRWHHHHMDRLLGEGWCSLHDSTKVITQYAFTSGVGYSQGLKPWAYDRARAKKSQAGDVRCGSVSCYTLGHRAHQQVSQHTPKSHSLPSNPTRGHPAAPPSPQECGPGLWSDCPGA